MPALLALLALLVLAAPASAARGEPRLAVPREELREAFRCSGPVAGATRRPIMLVTGTGASGDEAYAIGKGAFDHHGAPVCWVNFPHHTTADMQVSAQYLVYGLRRMHRRAGRRIAVFGISQGGVLPRVALTYWPSLRRKVSDVLSAAGTHHGTTAGRLDACRDGCVPAYWQQARGSDFLDALNARRDETPGRRVGWTTVRSATDETVRPHPTSKLRGATNVLIQDVCPGREVSHIGVAVDSVTFALGVDAIAHRGPARVSRLPADVCSHPYAEGLDEAGTRALVEGATDLTSSRGAAEPKVRREPRLRRWMRQPAAPPRARSARRGRRAALRAARAGR